MWRPCGYWKATGLWLFLPCHNKAFMETWRLAHRTPRQKSTVPQTSGSVPSGPWHKNPTIFVQLFFAEPDVIERNDFTSEPGPLIFFKNCWVRTILRPLPLHPDRHDLFVMFKLLRRRKGVVFTQLPVPDRRSNGPTKTCFFSGRNTMPKNIFHVELARLFQL